MVNYEMIITDETKKFIEYARMLANLEENFRTYIFERGLSENNYKIAADEYSQAIKPLKEKIEKVEQMLNEMREEITEKTNYVSFEMLDSLNIELGRIWRIINANEAFANDYGGVQLGDEPSRNLYKEIYEEHLEELKVFMYYFIKVANMLFSK